MEQEAAGSSVAAAVTRGSGGGEKVQTESQPTVVSGVTRSAVSGRGIRVCGFGDVVAGRSADHRAALPGPGRLGKQLRRIEEPVGLGGLYDARPEALPGDGADYGPGLQLVDSVHAAGNSGEARRSDYLTAASAARHRTADAARQSNQGGGHQHAFQGAGDGHGFEQGERVSSAY